MYGACVKAKNRALPCGKARFSLFFNGIVYDRDVTQDVGDGFFFTIGYGNMTGGELLLELLHYGVSSISLSTTGSLQQGVRACTSRMRNELYDVLQERMKAFHEDHPLN